MVQKRSKVVIFWTRLFILPVLHHRDSKDEIWTFDQDGSDHTPPSYSAGNPKSRHIMKKLAFTDFFTTRVSELTQLILQEYEISGFTYANDFNSNLKRK